MTTIQWRLTYRLPVYLSRVHLGQWKLFITGQAKLNLSTIQLNVWAADKFITADILFLSVALYFYKPNKSKNHIATVFIT